MSLLENLESYPGTRRLKNGGAEAKAQAVEGLPGGATRGKEPEKAETAPQALRAAPCPWPEGFLSLDGQTPLLKNGMK